MSQKFFLTLQLNNNFDYLLRSRKNMLLKAVALHFHSKSILNNFIFDLTFVPTNIIDMNSISVTAKTEEWKNSIFEIIC